MQDPPEILIDKNQLNNFSDTFQSWILSGESCRDGTIPIIRTKEQDILRAGSIGTFARKYINYDKHEVYPHLYADNRPRLFIYWTAVVRNYILKWDGWSSNSRLYIYNADGYQHTGCYNLKCPGFVQINKNIALRGSISPTSTYNGKQFEIKLTIWKDPKSGNRWFGFGSIVIGYWPSSMFPELKGIAHAIQFGGEIININPRGSHT
ncbi:hypothetical protein TSUD_189590 [Trifolium subterraneum]|uniref:Neprosin PEP catalytic domain-containing protein n=1 Tax=Trifolium subterraneum TaxID=3900 RepID=A0A2Z6M7H6_TRISU|nr:hypothetical protein TSUD_189590 [Trifolium subterraneum]